MNPFDLRQLPDWLFGLVCHAAGSDPQHVNTFLILRGIIGTIIYHQTPQVLVGD